MSRVTAAVDRVVALLLGLLLLAVGVILVARGFGEWWVQDLLRDFDLGDLHRAPTRPWWPWFVAGLVALSALLGAALIRANLARSPDDPVFLAASDDTGDLSIVLPPVAEAIAGDLRSTPGVRLVSVRTRIEAGLPILDVTVTAPPDVDPMTIAARADTNAVDLAAATDGRDVALRTFLRFDPYRRTTH